MEKYLAHSPTEDRPSGQPLKEHLENVAALSASFCEPFGAADDGRLCGLYHDIGKYSEAFQRRLYGSAGTVDHSTAGAYLLFHKRNIPVSMCIAGHHAGLTDLGTRNDLAGTYMARINKANSGFLEDYSAWEKEISNEIPIGYKSLAQEEIYFYTKMLFSALTDADWLDTDAYFRNEEYIPSATDFERLWNMLDSYILPWWNAESAINIRRCSILRSAIEHGSDEPGIFALTVPTGGGKTVASMAFALRHAVQYNMQRVIYVTPYCSILDQTQAVFEEIFGKENIIAHYSGAEFEHDEIDPDDFTAFSTENWEAPIILTTAVQFFESLYSAKPGKNRKLHNIAKSVIVFDEAQMLPVPFLRPCLAGICQLAKNFHCSPVLCTATQPAVNDVLQEFVPSLKVREICPEPQKMYQLFRRVTYVDDGLLSDEELADKLGKCNQVLCVVNSRKQAQALYRLLPQEEGTYHLSTMMIPADRKSTLDKIRERLRVGEPCRVISTSLIEAGVDVDFPEVYRALTGLDSIIQAGGRCNREGKRELDRSIVHIFRTETKAPLMLEQNISAADRTLKRYQQADSPEAIHEYFDFLLYTLKDKSQLDREEILENTNKLNFAFVSEHFHLIDGADYTVYIPVREAAGLISGSRFSGLSRSQLRKLGEYAVNVYKQYFQALYDEGAIEKISEKAGILTNINLYSTETGLPFEISEQDNAIFI